MQSIKTILSDNWMLVYGAMLLGVSTYLYYRPKPETAIQQIINESKQQSNMEMVYRTHPLYRICITGGPCGGKTSCMKIIRDHFMSKGFNVFSVPEIATFTVIGGGSINCGEMQLTMRLETETLMMRIQMAMQDHFMKMAMILDHPTILLYDRGVMDMTAYITMEQRDAILEQQQWNIVELRDERYDLVLFLVTAADGAEEFYTLQNNQARKEGVKQARDLDLRTMNVYTGHPHLHVIHNQDVSTFQQKIERCIHSMQDYMSPTSQKLKTKRFRVSNVQFDESVVKVNLHMRIIYLRISQPDIIEDKLIRRGTEDSNIYIRWTKRIDQESIQYYAQRRLNGIEYINTIANEADPNISPLDFDRIAFIYERQQFTLDDIKAGQHKLQVLSYFCRNQDMHRIKLPPFMQINSELLDQPALHRHLKQELIHDVINQA